MTKKELAKEFMDNLVLTKEQYIELCKLVDELGLDIPEHIESWEELAENL